MQHYCGERYDPPMHEWIPRVADPKVCPRCKVYLNQPARKPKPAKEPIILPDKPPEKAVEPVVVKKPVKPKTIGGQGLLIQEEVIPTG